MTDTELSFIGCLNNITLELANIGEQLKGIKEELQKPDKEQMEARALMDTWHKSYPPYKLTRSIGLHDTAKFKTGDVVPIDDTNEPGPYGLEHKL